MSIKKLYYKLEKSEFNKLIKEYKNSSLTKSFLMFTSSPYYYYPTEDINLLILDINLNQKDLDNLIDSFEPFTKKQILQSFLLDEIVATNSIENIYSTKHDIFYCLNKLEKSYDKKIISIVNAYRMLLEEGFEIKSLKDIRDIYDRLFVEAIAKEDLPDGKYFRKGDVYISDGLKNVHHGISGEENINKAMNEFIATYNKSSNLYESLLLSHFLFETIHPYYDGNGRFGRFLLTNKLYKQTGSISAFIISTALLENKKKYYEALEQGRDIHSFGIINDYVIDMLNILNKKYVQIIDELKIKKEYLNSNNIDSTYSKNERRIHKLLLEATLFSEFGISNDEIVDELSISKRSLEYALNKFKKQNLLIDHKYMKNVFHKLDKNKI